MTSQVDRRPARRAAKLFRSPLVPVLAIGVGLVLLQQQPGRAQRFQEAPAKPHPMHRVAGVRDGVSAFPKADYVQVRPLQPGQVDFKHFHTPDESLALMRMWAQKHPGLVEIYTVGQSFEGRDIWQMTISNKKIGKDTDKPAFFIEGGRHSGESSGTEATLYFINHVLTGYGADPAITKLVDTKALYCKPHNNPDGNMLYLTTAQSNRSTVRPNDDDRDGFFDEDAGDDLDGDGFIRQMRKFVGEKKGNATKNPKDPSGRLMQRVGENLGDYVMYPEGIDNDNDGRYNEDGIGGLDLHRNYPENWRPMREATSRGWTQGGSGEYPLSEPETRAVFTFLMTHPNVAAAQTLDTAVPMLLRGPSTAREEEVMFPEDREIFQRFDKKGQEITGYPWAGDVYHTYATRGGGNPLTGEPPRDSPLFGHSPDFGYSYFGVPWYGDEIWNGGRFVDYDKSGRVDEIETLRWYDENRQGKGDFMAWTPFRHPTLGDVEIGGFNPKFYSQNPPPDLLETWARNEALFNLYMAQQLPQVKIAGVTTMPAKGVPVTEAVFDVTVTVTNEGLMPTALTIAKRVKMVRPDTCTIRLGQGQELVRAPQGKPQQRPAIEIDSLKAGETKTVTWQVKGTGKATVGISSTRGGVDSRAIDIGPKTT
jgi:hypothetical protein